MFRKILVAVLLAAGGMVTAPSVQAQMVDVYRQSAAACRETAAKAPADQRGCYLEWAKFYDCLVMQYQTNGPHPTCKEPTCEPGSSSGAASTAPVTGDTTGPGLDKLEKEADALAKLNRALEAQLGMDEMLRNDRERRKREQVEADRERDSRPSGPVDMKPPGGEELDRLEKGAGELARLDARRSDARQRRYGDAESAKSEPEEPGYAGVQSHRCAGAGVVRVPVLNPHLSNPHYGSLVSGSSVVDYGKSPPHQSGTRQVREIKFDSAIRWGGWQAAVSCHGVTVDIGFSQFPGVDNEHHARMRVTNGNQAAVNLELGITFFSDEGDQMGSSRISGLIRANGTEIPQALMFHPFKNPPDETHLQTGKPVQISAYRIDSITVYVREEGKSDSLSDSPAETAPGKPPESNGIPPETGDLLTLVQTGDLERVKRLLIQGANPDQADGLGYSGLMWAARKGFREIAAALVAKGANLNLQARDGYTALMFSVQRSDLVLAEFFLKRGANVNLRQNNGYTALAISGNVNPAMVQLLQRFGGVR